MPDTPQQVSISRPPVHPNMLPRLKLPLPTIPEGKNQGEEEGGSIDSGSSNKESSPPALVRSASFDDLSDILPRLPGQEGKKSDEEIPTIVNLKLCTFSNPPPQEIIVKRSKLEYYHKIKKELDLASTERHIEGTIHNPMPRSYSQRTEIIPGIKWYTNHIIKPQDYRLGVIQDIDRVCRLETENLAIKKMTLEVELGREDASFSKNKPQEHKSKKVTFDTEFQEVEEDATPSMMKCYLFEKFNHRISDNKLCQLARVLEKSEIVPPLWYIRSTKLFCKLTDPNNGSMRHCERDEILKFVACIMNEDVSPDRFIGWNSLRLAIPAIPVNVHDKLLWTDFVLIFDTVKRECRGLKEVSAKLLEEVIGKIESEELEGCAISPPPSLDFPEDNELPYDPAFEDLELPHSLEPLGSNPPTPDQAISES